MQRTGSVGPIGVTSDSTDCRRARRRSSTVALRRVEVPFRGAKGDNQSAMGQCPSSSRGCSVTASTTIASQDGCEPHCLAIPQCLPAPMAIRPAFRFALWTNFTASMILQKSAAAWLPCSASYRRHAMRCQNSATSRDAISKSPCSSRVSWQDSPVLKRPVTSTPRH